MTTTALPPNHDERMETYARNTEEFARRTSSAARFLAWVVGLVALLALIGVIVGFALWRGAQVDKPQLEPQFLQRVWYWDDFYDALIGRPSQKLAIFCAWVVDTRIIDGAVNGMASVVRATGSATRKLQSGYVRNYALGIAVGMAALIVFLLSRTWWS